MIIAENLGTSYGPKTAVDGISFTVGVMAVRVVVLLGVAAVLLRRRDA